MSTPFKGGRHIVLLRLASASALALASGLTLMHPLLDFFLGAPKYDPSVTSQFQVTLWFRVSVEFVLYFRISNSVMLSSDSGNILIIGFSLQGTVLNMFSSVFNVVKYNSDIVL